MMFRIRYEQIGGHTHMRVFVGSSESSLANCGTLIMRNEEFIIFQGWTSTFINYMPIEK